jgi:two-component system response regulator NreC
MLNSKPARIILVDDHDMVRAGLRKLISERAGLVVAGEGKNGRDLFELLKKSPCDLVILDITMPEMDGLRTLELLRESYPSIRCIILSMHANPAYLKQTASRGAWGYILKEDAFDRLIWAVEEVLNGRKAFSRTITEAAVESYIDGGELSPQSADLLSAREKEVLAFVADGKTSREIAKTLGISSRTVESHRSRIMEKLGLPNSAALIKFAVTANLRPAP